MIKSELVTKLAEQTNLTKTDAENIVSTVFREITKALVQGNRVELRGFGVLSVRERKPRVGRNPKTGAKVEVASKKVPFFKAGKSINEALNKDQKSSKK